MLMRLENLENRLKSRYKLIVINDENCFLTKNKEIIHLTGLEDFNAIVTEHAETIEEARKHMYDDGDLLYMDEMNEDEMYEAILNEIER